MGSLNLYKIDDSKKQTFFQELSNKMDMSQTIFIHKLIEDTNVEFGLTLFYSRPNGAKDVKWNWLLKKYNKEEIHIDPSPSAVLLIEKDDETVYAATYGHSYFIVDKYADKDFGFNFARKISFDEIKTTTLTTPNSRRNKTVNTYINYDELEFDSGESFAKLKAKVELDDEFTLFKPSLEVGTSIRCVTESDSLECIVSIICYIENTIYNKVDIYNIPVFTKVKDKEQIALLNTRMEEKVKDNPEISISELDIVGVTEIFNHNDSEFVFKYGRKTKNVTSLSCDELRLFCQEHNLTFENVVLDIQVQSLYEGNVVSCALVRDLIDFTDDEERCLLSKGIWYQYNDDYLKYLRDSIAEIRAEYHPSYDFNSQKHMEFIETFFLDARSDPSNAQKNDSEIRAALKKKYYTERAFNMLMEQDYGFQNFDRDSKSVSGAKVEIMDLYKDGIMYAVKVGNTSAKLCYAVDQSIASLRLYKHKLLNDMPEIHTVAIWLILERATHIEVDGVPDINSLDMLMLKNRLDQWKKEVRLQGYKPLIYINYKS